MNTSFHKDRITALALSSNSKYVVSASKDKTIKVWDVDTRELLRTLLGHKDRVNNISLTPDDSRILSASDDGTVKIWDLKSGDHLFTFSEHLASVTSVGISSNGRQVVSVANGVSGKNATLKAWDLESGRLRRSFPTESNLANAVVLTPDAKYAVTASSISRHVMVWDIETGENIMGFCSDTGSRQMDIDVSPDGHLVVSCGDCGEINLFDIENGIEIFKLYHFEYRLYESEPWKNPGLMMWNIGFLDNGRSIMSCSYDGTIKIWNVASREVTRSLYLGTLLTASTISADGSNIIAGDENGQVYFIMPKR